MKATCFSLDEILKTRTHLTLLFYILMYHTPELQHSFVTLNQKTISQNRFLVEQRQIKVSMLYDMNMQLVQKQVRDMYNYNKQLNS